MIQIEKSDLGEIHYHLPGVDEMLMLMHYMGADASKLTDKEYMSLNQFKFMANIIKNMGGFVDKVELKVDELTLSTYEDAKKHMACMKMLINIAEKLLASLYVNKKKKQ